MNMGQPVQGLHYHQRVVCLGEDQDQKPDDIETVSRWLLINIAVTERGMIIKTNNSSPPRRNAVRIAVRQSRVLKSPMVQRFDSVGLLRFG
jgi:hypothetical protein